MAFTGKATYAAGAGLPEIAEDVADLVSINSPFETPLLDAIGDATRPARATLHEWLEDTLLPNSDVVNDTVFGNTLTDTVFDVANASRFRVGDQIQLEGSTEVMLVTAVNTGANQLTVVRGYGGSTATRWSTRRRSPSWAMRCWRATTRRRRRFTALAEGQLYADLRVHRGGERLGAGGAADRHQG